MATDGSHVGAAGVPDGEPSDTRSGLVTDADLATLRAKYGPVAEAEASKVAAREAPPPSYPEFVPVDAEEAIARAAHTDSKDDKTGVGYDNLVMCDECHGSGIRTEQYNHMLIDKSCRKCDGDGLVLKRGVDADEARERRAAASAAAAAAAAELEEKAKAEGDGDGRSGSPRRDSPRDADADSRRDSPRTQ